MRLRIFGAPTTMVLCWGIGIVLMTASFSRSQEPSAEDWKQRGFADVVRAVVLSDDATLLAYGMNSGALHVYDVQNDTVVRRLYRPRTPVAAVAFDASGTRVIATGTSNVHWMIGYRHSVAVGLDEDDQREYQRRMKRMILRDGVQGLLQVQGPILMNGKTMRMKWPKMAAGVQLFDLQDAERAPVFVARDEQPVIAVKVAADGTSVGLLDNDVRFHNIPTSVEEPADLARLSGGPRPAPEDQHASLENRYLVPSASFSADARRVVALRPAGSKGFVLRILNPATGEMDLLDPADADAGSPWTVDVSSDGRRFLTAGENNRVVLWDYDARTKIKDLINTPEEDDHVVYVKYSSDSRYVFTYDAKHVARIWSLDGDRLIASFKIAGPDAPGIRVAALHEGRLVMVFGGDRPAPARRGDFDLVEKPLPVSAFNHLPRARIVEHETLILYSIDFDADPDV